MLPASLCQPEALSHVLDGLVPTWAGWEGHLPHLSHASGPVKAGKGGNRDQREDHAWGGAISSRTSCMNSPRLPLILTLTSVVLGMELSIMHARQVPWHLVHPQAYTKKSHQELGMVANVCNPNSQ